MNFFFSVFEVIENGTEEFDQADIKTDSFQVRNPLFFHFNHTSMRSNENVSVRSIHVFIPDPLLGLIIKKISFRINIVSDSPPQVPSYKNHHMPPQLSYLKTICCSCCSNVKAPSVFPATLRLHFPLWNVHWLKRLLLARELVGWKLRAVSLGNWVRPASTRPLPRPHGCISQDSDGNLFFLP